MTLPDECFLFLIVTNFLSLVYAKFRLPFGQKFAMLWGEGGLGMRFYRWVKKWAERVAALRIPLYAGNSAFFCC